MKWNNITLKRGITDDMDMWKWRKLVEEGKVDEARKNGSIVLFNQHGKEIARWDFVNAWPARSPAQASTRRTTRSASRSWRSRTRAISG